jgi:diacylglycerol O-acyltransferase
MVPYAFPRPLRGDDDTGLRNQWCFISMGIPVEMPISQSLPRLAESKRRCDALKASPEAAIQFGVQAALAQVLPFKVQAATALDIMLKHSMVFSNVPGPDQVVYFAGEPLLDFYAVIIEPFAFVRFVD